MSIAERYTACMHLLQEAMCPVWNIISFFGLQHGESICNMYGRIGGNSELSERGKQVLLFAVN